MNLYFYLRISRYSKVIQFISLFLNHLETEYGTQYKLRNIKFWNQPSWSFHVVVLQRTSKKCTEFYNPRAESLFCSLNLLLAAFSCHCCCGFLKLPNCPKPPATEPKTYFFSKTSLVPLHYTSLPSLKLSIPSNRHFIVLLMVLQAKTIGEFVSKFADLQAELETLIQAQR